MDSRKPSGISPGAGKTLDLPGFTPRPAGMKKFYSKPEIRVSGQQ